MKLLAAISAADVGNLIIWVLLAALAFFVVNWLLGYTRLGEPWAMIVRVLLAILVIILIVSALNNPDHFRVIGEINILKPWPSR